MIVKVKNVLDITTKLEGTLVAFDENRLGTVKRYEDETLSSGTAYPFYSPFFKIHTGALPTAPVGNEMADKVYGVTVGFRTDEEFQGKLYVVAASHIPIMGVRPSVITRKPHKSTERMEVLDEKELLNHHDNNDYGNGRPPFVPQRKENVAITVKLKKDFNLAIDGTLIELKANSHEIPLVLNISKNSGSWQATNGYASNAEVSFSLIVLTCEDIVGHVSYHVLAVNSQLNEANGN